MLPDRDGCGRKVFPMATTKLHYGRTPNWHRRCGGYNELVATVTFEQARGCVIAKVGQSRAAPETDVVSLAHAHGRVLAQTIYADRDSPAAPRSVRDGFAVRAADLPGKLWVIGEVRAGESFDGEVEPGQAVEIMTGAPMPAGADCVVGRLRSDG
jgi:molybdopterin molybdotransferase